MYNVSLKKMFVIIFELNIADDPGLKYVKICYDSLLGFATKKSKELAPFSNPISAPSSVRDPITLRIRQL